MPILRSSVKDQRRTARRTARNKAAVHALRTAVKKVHLQIGHRDSAGAQAALAAAIPILDRAAVKGLIHKNAAARTKSRLVQDIRRMGAAPKA